MGSRLDISAYFSELDEQFAELIEFRKHGEEIPQPLRSRCEGYMRAAVVLGLITDQELQQRMSYLNRDLYRLGNFDQDDYISVPVAESN